MIAFNVPQVFTAIAYNKLSNILDKPLEVEVKDMPPYRVEYYK